jgi:hypothetical protein
MYKDTNQSIKDNCTYLIQEQADLTCIFKKFVSSCKKVLFRKWPYKKLIWYKSFTLIKAGVGKSIFSIALPRYQHRKVKEDLS